MTRSNTPEGILADPAVLFAKVDQVENGQLNGRELQEWVVGEWARVNRAISRRPFEFHNLGRMGMKMLYTWDRRREIIGGTSLYEAKIPYPTADPNTRVELRHSNNEGKAYELIFNAPARGRARLFSVMATRRVPIGYHEDMYSAGVEPLYNIEDIEIKFSNDSAPVVNRHFSSGTVG